MYVKYQKFLTIKGTCTHVHCNNLYKMLKYFGKPKKFYHFLNQFLLKIYFDYLFKK